ncbi:MAG: hypothetical protein JXB00_05180 [Bacteroidales bacterium]|nr:hypothetical protein [Bacteroidales bacterium]
MNLSLTEISHLPATGEILSLRIISNSPAIKNIPDNDEFLHLWDGLQILHPGDKRILNWHYAPWFNVEFSANNGHYVLHVYLGGMGIIELPDGMRGAVLFTL